MAQGETLHSMEEHVTFPQYCKSEKRKEKDKEGNRREGSAPLGQVMETICGQPEGRNWESDTLAMCPVISSTDHAALFSTVVSGGDHRAWHSCGSSENS